MADNVELNAGSGGATCATDDCGAAGHTQIVKLAVATDGSATLIPADANGLQVKQQSAGNLNATVIGTVTANLGATDNAVIDDIAANQTDASQKTQVVDGSGNVIGATSNALDINIKSGNPTTITATQGTASNLKVEAALAANQTLAAVTNITNAVAVTNADITTLAGAVAATHMQCDVLTAPSTAVTNEGTFAVQATLAAETSKVIGTVNIAAAQTVAAVTNITNAVAVTNADITTIAGAVAATHMQCDVLSAPSTAVTNTGTFAVQATLAASDGVDIGNVDVASIASGANLIGDISIQPRAGGGATPHSRLSTGDTNDFVSVTDGATNLLGGWITNTNAAVRYIKFYNKATAPDPSADAASILLRFAIPGATTGGGGVFNIPCGVAFGTGLGYALVTAVADTNETAVAANEIIVNLWYKH